MFVDNTLLDIVLRGICLTAIALAWTVFVVWLVGLRAFSKMTAFGFVATVATGSLLAGAAQSTGWSGFGQSIIAIGGLLGVQYLVARARKASETFEAVVQNSPVLLMRNGEIFHQALSDTRVEQDDLIAKLREANVHDLNDVQAVVL